MPGIGGGRRADGRPNEVVPAIARAARHSAHCRRHCGYFDRLDERLGAGAAATLESGPTSANGRKAGTDRAGMAASDRRPCQMTTRPRRDRPGRRAPRRGLPARHRSALSPWRSRRSCGMSSRPRAACVGKSRSKPARPRATPPCPAASGAPASPPSARIEVASRNRVDAVSPKRLRDRSALGTGRHRDPGRAASTSDANASRGRL